MLLFVLHPVNDKNNFLDICVQKIQHMFNTVQYTWQQIQHMFNTVQYTWQQIQHMFYTVQYTWQQIQHMFNTVQYTCASFTMKNVFKGTVSVILNDPLCKDSTALFTIVPLNIKGSVREK